MQALGKTPSSMIWDEKSKNSGAKECGRYALVVCNVLFIVLGAFLVCYGVWFKFVPANQNLASITSTTKTRYTLQLNMNIFIATGISTILFAGVGCCGAVSNSKYVLGLFFLFLIVLLAELVTVGLLTITMANEIATGIEYQMRKSLMESYAGDGATNQESLGWNTVQRVLKCCGVSDVNGYEDYRNATVAYAEGSKWWEERSDEPNPQLWPDSCCRNKSTSREAREACHRDSAKPADVIFVDGCLTKVKDFIEQNLIVVRALAIMIILTEIAHFFTVRRLEKALPNDTKSIVTNFSAEDLNKVEKQA